MSQKVSILLHMRILCIAVLALFFSFGFSQGPELGNPPELAPAGSDTNFVESVSEPAVQEPAPVAQAFGNIQPFAPKGEFEKQKDFDARKSKWEKETINNLTAKDTTAKGYANRIELAKELGFDALALKAAIIMLEDRIVAEDSKLITQKAPNAKVELSSYNAETETFDLRVQDTENTTNPFIFQGSVTVPMSMAKTMDRENTSDFSTSVVFLNAAYEPDEATKLNLAMQKLLLYKGSKNLNVKGSFEEVELGNMSGYYAYKQRTDSIFSGILKSHDLSYKDALKIAGGGQSSSGEPLMGWRGWTRIAAFTLAVASGVGAAFKNSEARKYKDDINELEWRARERGIYDGGPNADDPYKGTWTNQYLERKDELKKNENYRNIFGISAGVFAAVGVATFFF